MNIFNMFLIFHYLYQDAYISFHVAKKCQKYCEKITEQVNTATIYLPPVKKFYLWVFQNILIPTILYPCFGLAT